MRINPFVRMPGPQEALCSCELWQRFTPPGKWGRKQVQRTERGNKYVSQDPNQSPLVFQVHEGVRSSSYLTQRSQRKCPIQGGGEVARAVPPPRAPPRWLWSREAGGRSSKAERGRCALQWRKQTPQPRILRVLDTNGGIQYLRGNGRKQDWSGAS